MQSMVTQEQLQTMDEQALRHLARSLLVTVSEQSKQLEGTEAMLAKKQDDLQRNQALLREKEFTIAKLTQEMALYRRWRFDRRSEQLSSQQRLEFEETVDADLAAIEIELQGAAPKVAKPATPQQPKRLPLPANLPRKEFLHEPQSLTCGCGCALKRIGEDISEKLDYTPGIFTVERHIRGKWVCGHCQTLTQAPVAPHIIDKGLASTGLLAQVLVAKYADHLPLYRQEQIFARAGLAIARSTLAQWVGACGVALDPLAEALRAAVQAHDILHADETPVQMLKPGDQKTHRAYIWAYSPGEFESLKAVVYDFTESRSGKNAQSFLGQWQGRLLVDDFSGYKALFEQGITELGCMAHVRRKFHDLYQASGSEIAQQALVLIGHLYAIEQQAKGLDPESRWRIRQEKAKPMMDRIHAWLQLQRTKATEGTALARAIDYGLRRWQALVRYLEDGRIPIDNNHIENRIRPIAIGRNNWLFAGSLRAGKRAAAIMSLIQSAKLNGHDPYEYLKDVLTRLPTHPYRRIEDLLPHRWQPEHQLHHSTSH